VLPSFSECKACRLILAGYLLGLLLEPEEAFALLSWAISFCELVFLYKLMYFVSVFVI
jgi:ABC-type cobalamin transport system permease subunit